MIVLQLTSDYIPNPLWGMGWHVNFLTNALRDKGLEVYVGTANKSNGAEKNIISTDSECDKRYLSDKPYEIFGDFENFLTWQKLLGKAIINQGIKPDIIHCHNWMSWISAAEIKKKYPDAKVISTFHLLQKQYDTMSENPVPEGHERIIGIEGEMMGQSERVIVQSDSQMDLITKGYGYNDNLRKIKIIPSGFNFRPIEFEEILKKRKANPFIDMSFVGRIETDKGIYETLEAFTLLSNDYKNVRMNILGKGPRLEEIMEKFPLERIIYHGFVDRDRLEETLINSSIFCLPSSSESFGNSLVEAMALGVVPIFSRGKTVPKLFEEKVHGLNVPLIMSQEGYRARPEDIIGSMKYLLDNRKVLERFSRKAYKFSRSEYSMEKMVSRVLDIYRGVL